MAYASPSTLDILVAARDYHRHGAPAASHTRMDYGTMPSRADFDAAFDAYCPDGKFSFGNDPYVGTDTLNASQLWRELEAQYEAWTEGKHDPECPGDGSCSGDGCPGEDAGAWCSCVLGILGFEWI